MAASDLAKPRKQGHTEHPPTSSQHGHTHDASLSPSPGSQCESESSHDHSHDSEHSHSHSVFGHSHAHHQPNELLSTSFKTIRTNPAVRITWIGLVVNVSLAVSKGLGGVYFHSQALIADAIHSVSDMFADFLTLATVNVLSKIGLPTNFPLGYGKVETVGSLLVSGILLFAGVGVGWTSLLQIFEFVLPTYLFEMVSQIHIGHSHTHEFGSSTSQSASDHGHSHSHSHAPVQGNELAAETTMKQIPNINAAWLAGASIIVKELLFRKTMKVAVDTNSKVLVANAWHHRIDSLTAFVALLTVTGGVVFNVAWLDSIGGIAVSFLIIRAGWDSFKVAWYELIDRGERPGMEIYDKVEGIISSELTSNSDLSQFQMKKLSVLTSGANTNVYIWLATKEDKQFTLKQLNVIENKLKYLIKRDDHFIKKVFIRWIDESVEDYDYSEPSNVAKVEAGQLKPEQELETEESKTEDKLVPEISHSHKH